MLLLPSQLLLILAVEEVESSYGKVKASTPSSPPSRSRNVRHSDMAPLLPMEATVLLVKAVVVEVVVVSVLASFAESRTLKFSTKLNGEPTQVTIGFSLLLSLPLLLVVEETVLLQMLVVVSSGNGWDDAKEPDWKKVVRSFRTLERGALSTEADP